MSRRPPGAAGAGADAAPALVTDTDALAALCGRLRAERFVTVDTEFMRERTYWPELCVVQLAGDSEVAVVDALAPGIDLAPLGELLADPNVLKVFHAARQDIEIFLLRFGAVPAPLHDTQIAAQVAGFGDQAMTRWPARWRGRRSTRRTASATGRRARSPPRRSPTPPPT